MDGGSAQRQGSRHRRRRPWGWGLFLVVVLALRVTSVGGETAVAGADAAVEDDVADGDPAATKRLSWVVGGAEALIAGDAARACLEAGTGCGGDAALAVDTTRARAGALGQALAVATDPASEGYLGEPSSGAQRSADAVREAAASVDDVLGRWMAAGCGGTVDGVPVEVRPPECPDLAQAGIGALDGLQRAIEGWQA